MWGTPVKAFLVRPLGHQSSEKAGHLPHSLLTLIERGREDAYVCTLCPKNNQGRKKRKKLFYLTSSVASAFGGQISMFVGSDSSASWGIFSAFLFRAIWRLFASFHLGKTVADTFSERGLSGRRHVVLEKKSRKCLALRLMSVRSRKERRGALKGDRIAQQSRLSADICTDGWIGGRNCPAKSWMRTVS